MVQEVLEEYNPKEGTQVQRGGSLVEQEVGQMAQQKKPVVDILEHLCRWHFSSNVCPTARKTSHT